MRIITIRMQFPSTREGHRMAGRVVAAIPTPNVRHVESLTGRPTVLIEASPVTLDLYRNMAEDLGAERMLSLVASM
jgi:hypothetical protein